MPNQFQSDLKETDIFSSAAYSGEYKRSLLAKLIYLLDNIPAEHKNTLVKSKINTESYQNFDMQQALKGDAYYRSFFTTLNIVELELLLLSLRPGLELNRQQDPRLAALFDYVYRNKPLATTEYKVDSVIKAISDVFSDSSRAEALRQHEEDVALNPGLELTDYELQQCGLLAPIFKLYLPKLAPSAELANFNEVIRNKIIKEPSISIAERHRRLELTTRRLADLLEVRGFVQDAFELRSAVFGPKYASERLDEYRIKRDKSGESIKDIPRAAPNGRLTNFMQSVLNAIRRRRQAPIINAQKRTRKVLPLDFPATLDSSPTFKLNTDMSKRLANVQKGLQTTAAELSRKSVSMTPSFSRTKPPGFEMLFPETSGPRKNSPKP